MRVNVYPADNGGCGLYRMRWPAQALADVGHDVTIIGPGDPGQLEAVYVDDPAPRVIDVVAPDVDVVVLQRPMARRLVEGIELLQRKGIRVVVEIDDDLGALHRHNVSWPSCHPRFSPDRNWNHLAHACRIADLVTVTTPHLARRYSTPGKFAVLPNCVPARYLDLKADPRDGVFVGWTGSIDTHPTDLQVTRGAISRALAGTGAMFAVVGTGKGVQAGLDLERPPNACGWLEIDTYPAAMAQLDVGIVPLADIAFNRGKSGLKMAEFAALGVPVVASPTPDNVRLHADGIGRLAGKPKDWLREIRRLIVDEAWRAELADRGRSVMSRHTIEGNAWRWAEAWASTVKSRRASA